MRKRRVALTVALVLVLTGALAAWWWVRSDPGGATKFLIDRGLDAHWVEAVVSWLGAGSAEEQPATLTATGTVEGDEIAIASEFGGAIVRLNAEEGDEVEKGQLLVELDTSVLEAKLAQAEAAVAAAEANLANVEAGQHPAVVWAAEAALAQATAQRDAAVTAWHDAEAILEHPQQIDAQIVQVQAELDLADVAVEQAQARLKAAETQRDQYRAQGSMQEKWLYRIYDYQVVAAQAGVEAAQATRSGAEQKLRTLRALRANPIALVSQVHLAEQQARLAEAGVSLAEARLAEAEAGPTAEELAVAKAQVAQAQALADLVRTQIEKMKLRSPVDGVVTSQVAHQGETAVAGMTLLSVANLDEVRVTVYVPEDRLGQVFLGQEVDVRVDAHPERVFRGEVSYVAQEAQFTPRNVQTEEERVNLVFAVRVRVPNPGHLLKPGMAADVTFR